MISSGLKAGLHLIPECYVTPYTVDRVQHDCDMENQPES
jgi:hypothetical protein